MKGLLDTPLPPNDVADAERNSGPISASDRRSKRNHEWTLTHSHFALMGGFAFEAGAPEDSILPNGCNRVALTSHALRKLAECEPDMIPDISEKTIKSKGKADFGARLWVFLQFLGFLYRIFERFGEGRPISVLEWTTVIQVLYCLVFFIAWWKKPLDVSEPRFIPVDTNRKRQICAWMIMNSTLGVAKRIKHKNVEPTAWLVHNEDTLRANSKDDIIQKLFERVSSSNRKMGRPEDIDYQEAVSRQDLDMHGDGALKMHLGQTIHGFRLYHKQNDRANDRFLEQAHTSLRKNEVECIRLASSFRAQTPREASGWEFTWREDIADRKDMVMTHISTHSPPPDDNIYRFAGNSWVSRPCLELKFVQCMYIFVVGGFFGLLHLLAWDAPFPHEAVRWSWRTSCLVVGSPVAVSLLSFSVYSAYLCLAKKVSTIWSDVGDKRGIVKQFFETDWSPYHGLSVPGGLYFMLVVGCGVLLVVCRVYLIVGCFVNLAYLPAEVYQGS